MQKKPHFLHIIFYYFKKGKKQLKCKKKKMFMCGKGTGTDWMCSQWFVKFHAGDFTLDDAPQSGRPVEVDSDQIETLIENNQHYTMRKIANIPKIFRSRVENHLHQLGYVHHFDVCVPHKLSGKNLLDHISAWNSLLKHNENILSSKQIVMGNEKWILHNNVECKRSWGKWNEPPPATLKASLHLKKVMCIWWDWKGVLYYEILQENQMIKSKYCSKLDQLRAALDEKCPELCSRKCTIFIMITQDHMFLW